jgi:hypothetical protein
MDCSTYVASGVSEVRARTILRDLRGRDGLIDLLRVEHLLGPGLSMRLRLLCRLAALLHDCS